MQESSVWRFIKTKHGPDLAIERIEALHPPGMSDCFWTDRVDRVSGWLELKFTRPGGSTYPSFRRGEIPNLKPHQALFLRRQADNNVPAGILLSVDNDRFYLFPARPDHEWAKWIQGPVTMQRAAMFWSHRTFTLRECIQVLKNATVW